MTYSKRFYKIAQLLFTTEVSDEEKNAARKVSDELNKIDLDLKSWIETMSKNLEVFNNYHDNEKSLVVISEKFEQTQQKQKQNYERIINDLKKTIESMGTFHDVEMQDMVVNLTKTSEEFTKLYNEINNLPNKIGEVGFIQSFKDASQKLIDSDEALFDVIERVKDYIMKNVLGEQSLS